MKTVVLIDGPAHGQIVQTKDKKEFIVPLTTNPAYSCAIYRLTDQVTHLGELVAIFHHCKKR